MRTAVIYNKGSKVVLWEGLHSEDPIIIAVSSGHSINIQVSDEIPRWIVNILDSGGKSISHMFADYIQKGNY